MGIDLDMSDLTRLGKTIEKLGKLPQKCVTKAARKGGNVVMKAVKQSAPEETGDLKKGIKLKAEKSHTSGKKVYEVTFDAGMNDVFQKPIKNPGEAGGKNKTAYYPASMEYGYFSRNGRYIPGYHFMRKSADGSEAEMTGVTIKVLADEVEKEWSKK